MTVLSLITSCEQAGAESLVHRCLASYGRNRFPRLGSRLAEIVTELPIASRASRKVFSVRSWSSEALKFLGFRVWGLGGSCTQTGEIGAQSPPIGANWIPRVRSAGIGTLGECQGTIYASSEDLHFFADTKYATRSQQWGLG